MDSSEVPLAADMHLVFERASATAAEDEFREVSLTRLLSAVLELEASGRLEGDVSMFLDSDAVRSSDPGRMTVADVSEQREQVMQAAARQAASSGSEEVRVPDFLVACCMALGDQEMEQSAQALGENAPDISSPHQEKAIEHLKSAQEKLSEQFTARMENMTGMMFGSGTRYDPLGRPYRDPGSGDGGDGSQVKVPSDAEQKRAREILDLLRRRSGERDRPMLEREYYRRLLKQF